MFALKLFTKRLTRQVNRMESQAKHTRKKAIERRTAGDIPGSRMHMKSSLQFRKWAIATDSFRVRLEGVQYKLEQAQSMKDFTGIATEIASLLGGLKQSVQAPQLAQILGELDLGFGNMEGIMSETTNQLEISEDASSSAVSDSEVDDALAEVDAELSLDTDLSLPSVPGMIDGEKIDDLEAEIQRLKRNRS